MQERNIQHNFARYHCLIDMNICLFDKIKLVPEPESCRTVVHSFQHLNYVPHSTVLFSKTVKITVSIQQYIFRTKNLQRSDLVSTTIIETPQFSERTPCSRGSRPGMVVPKMKTILGWFTFQINVQKSNQCPPDWASSMTSSTIRPAPRTLARISLLKNRKKIKTVTKIYSNTLHWQPKQCQRVL